MTGGSVTPPSGTTVLDDRGTEDLADDLAYVVFDLDLDAEGITADVTEVVQVDNDFVDAFCYDSETEAERGTVGAGTVTGVEVNAGEIVVCEFFNTSGEQQGETATPSVTNPPSGDLPDTATSPAGTPAGDGWRVVLLAIAGLLGTLLLLTPVPARSRRRR